MNLERKVKFQERTIASLQAKVEERDKKIQLLSNENESYKRRIEAVEKMETELDGCLADANEIRARYQQALRDLMRTKEEYTKKFKQLIKEVKANT